MEEFIDKEMDKDISANAARVISAIGNMEMKFPEGVEKVNMCRAMRELKQE